MAALRGMLGALQRFEGPMPAGQRLFSTAAGHGTGRSSVEKASFLSLGEASQLGLGVTHTAEAALTIA